MLLLIVPLYSIAIMALPAGMLSENLMVTRSFFLSYEMSAEEVTGAVFALGNVDAGVSVTFSHICHL